MTDEAVEATDVGEEPQVQKRKASSKTKRTKETEDLKTLLSTYGGRAFIWRVLSECGVYKASFTGVSASTDFNEGKRHIGLWTLGEIHLADPNAYAKIQLEAIQRGDR